MKFSVITPCYNCIETIKYTIESILNQDGNFELEYIIVDGGSTDGTIEVIKSYRRMFLQRNIKLIIISEPDNGMYDALAKGLNRCSGDIISYLNADDIYMKDTLNYLSKVFNKYKNIKWITSQPIIINEKSEVIEKKKLIPFKREFIRKGIYGKYMRFIMQEGTFWRKELNDDINYHELKKYSLAGDYYLWYTFSKENDLFLMDINLACFRKRKGQLSENKVKYIEEVNSMCDKINKFDFLQIAKLNTIQIVCDYFPDKILNKTKNVIIWDNNEPKLILN